METKVCSKCGERKPVEEFHMTKRKYECHGAVNIYRYHRKDCEECRHVDRVARYALLKNGNKEKVNDKGSKR